MALLGGRGLQGPPLHLSGLVVQEDPHEDEDGARGAEDGDVVAEHDDAQPDGERVFDRAGHAVGTRQTAVEGLVSSPDRRETRLNPPERDGGDPPHQRVRGDALQVEQGPVKKQQQDQVLVQA